MFQSWGNLRGFSQTKYLQEVISSELIASSIAANNLFSTQMELLDTILHELDQQLNSIPKSDLIAQEPNMSRMLQVDLNHIGH
jgi:tripartite motif-containing protein 37